LEQASSGALVPALRATFSRDPQVEPRIHPSRTAGASLAVKGASPAARSSMNARGGGVVSREARDLTKFAEGFSKPGEGKSKSLGRKFKAGGSEIQAFFFRESGLFKGLQANPIASRFSLRFAPSAAGAGARGRDKTRRRNASSQG